ncbi:MAG: cytochrome c [Acidobacteriota bacterium]
MNIKIIKLTSVAAMAVGTVWITLAGGTPALTTVAQADDVAAVYKTKCALCHTPKADKFYDPAKTEDEHVQIVLKGKKGEKPPYMPGFGEKGMKEEEAKALVQYMQSLRQPK